MAASAVPSGTFMPGTKVQVGSHRVVIEKYLSEGGFAHVYVVRLPKPVDSVETAVLKRVAVPDKSALANMRTEVETMKRLRGHKHIVTYIDSHASQLKGSGYEVFLLMEHCAGGGLMDFMNTRLQNRLTEPEILKIFSDVAEGVACMHYLKPPLLHRDLKVENVLISVNGSSFCYKLCDFGSAAPPRPAATSAAEGRLIEDDVQRHTTLQYRSPEMIDVYRKQPIDEKSDIWALGVLLYKLCYYVTPFEEAGQMAILNAKFKYPAYPVFSDRLKLLIASMLREKPRERLNIYEVLRETCRMRGKEVPIQDIYAGRSQSEARRYQQLPPSPTETPKVGAVFSAPVQETQIIPEIAPMRRGRPTRPTSQQNHPKASPSPLRASSNDPFAALDGSKQNSNADELSSRFPTLDQFSLLHEKGKFDFELSTAEANAQPEDITKRVTNALADEAFARLSPNPQKSPMLGSQSPAHVDATVEETNQKVSSLSRAESTRQQAPVHQPAPQKPKMVSTGTMTSSPPPQNHPEVSSSYFHKSVHKTPSYGHDKKRPSSLNHRPDLAHKKSNSLLVRPSFSRHEDQPEVIPKSPSSSRPSLEGSRPSTIDFGDPLTRSKSANAKARPANAYLGSPLDYFRDKGNSRSSFDNSSSSQDYESTMLRPSRSELDREYNQSNISSDVDFLRAKEEEEMNRKRDKRLTSGSKHVKRSSLTSLSISGTKTLLAGRFGDAFRRFESNAAQDHGGGTPPEDDKAQLTPITGSVVTDLSDNDREHPDPDDISPEMRRELERRRLSMEERRVANAGAEYRLKVAEKGEGGSRVAGLGIGTDGVSRAVSIENRLQSLRQETDKAPLVKTASGYGRFTDSGPATLPQRFDSLGSKRPTSSSIPRNTDSSSSDTHEFRPRPPPKDTRAPPNQSKQHTTSTELPARQAQRPAAPPKPKSLRTGNQPADAADQTIGSSTKRQPPVRGENDTHSGPKEDWEINFSRRYPSLSGLELVETEIDLPKAPKPPLSRTPTTTTMTTKEI